MKRYLLCLLATLSVLVLPVAHAADPAEGVNYFRVKSPALIGEPAVGKVEVTEAFNYACIHCFHFQPVVDAWSKTPAARKAQLRYLPAAFNPLFAVFARGFFVAEDLGVVEKTHNGVYDLVWNQHVTVQTIDGLADVYAKLGVDKAEFLKTANSFSNEMKSRQSLQLLQRYEVDGTPSVIVAGKYRVTSESAGSPEKVFDVVNWLVDKELAAAKKT
jgi:thiol:disulfide interchange protein DsbA